jgi:hypothetical protein
MNATETRFEAAQEALSRLRTLALQARKAMAALGMADDGYDPEDDVAVLEAMIEEVEMASAE